MCSEGSREYSKPSTCLDFSVFAWFHHEILTCTKNRLEWKWSLVQGLTFILIQVWNQMWRTWRYLTFSDPHSKTRRRAYPINRIFFFRSQARNDLPLSVAKGLGQVLVKKIILGATGQDFHFWEKYRATGPQNLNFKIAAKRLDGFQKNLVSKVLTPRGCFGVNVVKICDYWCVLVLKSIQNCSVKRMKYEIFQFFVNLNVLKKCS